MGGFAKVSEIYGNGGAGDAGWLGRVEQVGGLGMLVLVLLLLDVLVRLMVRWRILVEVGVL